MEKMTAKVEVLNLTTGEDYTALFENFRMSVFFAAHYINKHNNHRIECIVKDYKTGIVVRRLKNF